MNWLRPPIGCDSSATRSSSALVPPNMPARSHMHTTCVRVTCSDVITCVRACLCMCVVFHCTAPGVRVRRFLSRCICERSHSDTPHTGRARSGHRSAHCYRSHSQSGLCLVSPEPSRIKNNPRVWSKRVQERKRERGVRGSRRKRVCVHVWFIVYKRAHRSQKKNV